MELYKGAEIREFPDYAAWLEWLDAHHATADTLWVKFAKKASGIASITYEEAREGALRYGWIDGLKNAFDESYYTLRFTKRRPKGTWSKINREIVEGLIAAGKMHPAGLAEVAAAKQDGRWEAAYDSQSSMEVPADFQKELDAHPAAAAYFTKISSANRYAFLYRLQTAKKQETRERNITKFIEMLEAGETYH